MIPKSTPSDLVNSMINRDLEQLGEQNAQTACTKGEARANYEEITSIPKITGENPMRAVPNEWCAFLKCRSTPCPRCPKKICTPEHLQYEHNIAVYGEKLLWNDLREM